MYDIFFVKFFEKILRLFASQKNTLGTKAEKAAAKFLKQNKKLKIICLNWRSGHYETDIIAYDKLSDCIIFAEVKCRPNYAKVQGYYAATSKKKSSALRNCARLFLTENNSKNRNFRFDVLEVNHDGSGNILEINHFENIHI